MTGIGYGLLDARNLLNSKARVGAKKVVFLMTDGLANQYPSGWNLPSGFDWITITDIDSDGDSDYSTSDKAVKYTLYQANQLINQGVTIHTLCVGSGRRRAPDAVHRGGQRRRVHRRAGRHQCRPDAG